VSNSFLPEEFFVVFFCFAPASFETLFLASCFEPEFTFTEVCFRFAPQASQNLASALFSFPQTGQETALFRLSVVIFLPIYFF